MSEHNFTYPVVLNPEKEGGFYVTFPDLPWGVTDGDTRAEALSRAVDAIESVFIGLMSDGTDIPKPSAARGRATVTLPPLSAAKVALYRALRAARMSKAELARRLKWHPPQVDRLLDLRHASRLDQLDKALRVLGKRLVVEVRNAA